MFGSVLRNLGKETRRNFRWEFLSSGAFGLFAGLVMPFITVTSIRLGAPSIAVGLLAAAPCASLLVSFYWGSLAQDRPKLPFVVWPNIVGRAMLIMMLFVASPWPYVAVILLFWMITAVPYAAYPGLAESIYPREYRGRLLAYVRVASGVCQLGMLVIAGKMLDAYGYRIVFAAAAALGVLSAVLLAQITEPRASSRPAKVLSLRQQFSVLRSDRAFCMWQVGFSVFGLGSLFLAPVYPMYQVVRLGLSDTYIGMIAMCWTASWLVSHPFWGSLIDKKGPGRVIITTVALFGVCPLAYYFGGTFAAVLVGAAFSGAAEAGIDIGWMNQCIRLAPGKASLYSGLHLTILGIRGTIAPLMGAMLLPYLGMQNALLLGATAIFLGIVPMLHAQSMQVSAAEESSAKYGAENVNVLPQQCT